MIYQLACKHIFQTSAANALPKTREDCPVHLTAAVPVIAVECREWHMKCQNCRYGRWCGQSPDLAMQLAREHTRKHAMHVARVDFMRYEPTYKRFRQAFPGRKVRPVIITEDTRTVMKGIDRRYNMPRPTLPFASSVAASGDDPPF
jgi:hypothetical protein